MVGATQEPKHTPETKPHTPSAHDEGQQDRTPVTHDESCWLSMKSAEFSFTFQKVSEQEQAEQMLGTMEVAETVLQN